MNKSGLPLTVIAAVVILISIGLAAILSGLTPEGGVIPPEDGGSSYSDQGQSDSEGDNSSSDSIGAVKGGLKGGNVDAVSSGRLPGYEDKDINSNPEVFCYLLNSDVVLSSPDAKGSIMVENDPGNNCPMQLCYYIEDVDEPIYISPMIEPDEHVELDTLTTKLKKGEYSVNAVISVYDNDTMELKTTFHEEVTLTVNQKFLGLF